MLATRNQPPKTPRMDMDIPHPPVIPHQHHRNRMLAQLTPPWYTHPNHDCYFHHSYETGTGWVLTPHTAQFAFDEDPEIHTHIWWTNQPTPNKQKPPTHK